MSVYKDQPTVKITIATKAGSKLDPAETTGLAHYFEHLMFKGTKNFGTKDYAAEEPLLNEIERLFEKYRQIDESKVEERKAIYKQIDSVSQLAAQYAIPNLTFNDIKNFQKTHVSNQPTTYMIVGDTKALDMKYLKKIGKVKVLKLKTIFGY